MNREILVHIAAPSSLRDDVRYLAQVDAILGFQPGARQCILTTSAVPIEDTEPVASGDTHHDSWDDSPVSVIPDSQPATSVGDSQPPKSTVARKISPAPSTEHDDGPSKRRRLTSPHNDKTVATNTSGSRHIPSERQDAQAQGQQHQQYATDGDGDGDGDTETPAPAATATTPKKGHGPLSLPLEIKPPLPPISTSEFTTHITPTLAMLATRLKSPRTYTPLTQTRDLDILERGHWQVRMTITSTPTTSPAPNANTWDLAFFMRFWGFLSEFITELRAGWGVWCILEEDADSTAGTGTGTGGAAAAATSGNGDGNGDAVVSGGHHNTILRVYTWGEVASHIYLLLFLASERRIRNMGAQWRDGSDEVVIQMPSYTHTHAHAPSASSLGG